jgi:hypothetical protein
MKKEIITSVSRIGAFSLTLALLISAINDNDEAFFNETFGKNAVYFFTKKTNMSLERLKELCKETSKRSYSMEEFTHLIKTKSVKEVSEILNLSEKTVRNICTEKMLSNWS